LTPKRKTTKTKNPDISNPIGSPDEDEAIALARTVTRPSVQAAITLQDYGRGFGDLDLSGLIDSLSEQIALSRDGDMQRAEAMLIAQAHTLDAIFNDLARRAIRAEFMKNLDCYLKLALRAQSQCRATWEALLAIKNPPMMGYVRQANITHGPQQINNQSTDQNGAPRARKKKNLQNELLENNDGERLDLRTAVKTIQNDQEMATVGEVNGAQDGSR
jgi:hypothetical protein